MKVDTRTIGVALIGLATVDAFLLLEQMFGICACTGLDPVRIVFLGAEGIGTLIMIALFLTSLLCGLMLLITDSRFSHFLITFFGTLNAALAAILIFLAYESIDLWLISHPRERDMQTLAIIAVMAQLILAIITLRQMLSYKEKRPYLPQLR